MNSGPSWLKFRADRALAGIEAGTMAAGDLAGLIRDLSNELESATRLSAESQAGGLGNQEDEMRLRWIRSGLSVDTHPDTIAALDRAIRRLAAGGSVEGLDFEPDAQHAVADMANVGYSLMQAIKRHRPGYCWNESPAEIVSDLLIELDEAKAPTPSASVGGEVVAWQARMWENDHKAWSGWAHWAYSDRPRWFGNRMYEYRPLYAKPPALVVTEEMVQRALDAYTEAVKARRGDFMTNDDYPYYNGMEAALTAALAKGAQK